jgi:hypothetical protein
MRKKLIVLALALLVAVAGKAQAQDGSEYLLWEKTKDFATRCVAFSPDETQLAVLGEYNWNVDTSVIKILSVQNNGEELFAITTKSQSWKCFYSPDGKYFVVYGMEETQIYDAKTYVPVKTLTQCNLSFSTDNMLLARGKKGPSFEILTNGPYEKVFEKSYTPAQSNQVCSIDVFYTPDGKYLIVNLEYIWQDPYSGTETIQEVFDAKTFQKSDKIINCLKGFPNFSNNGLAAKSYGYLDDKNVKHTGFRISEYDKDSLIWEQETKNYDNLVFLNTKNYLISKFGIYQDGNPDMLVLKTWDYINKKIDKNIYCFHNTTVMLSKSDKYLCTTNGVSLWLYDFEKMFEGNVAVNEPKKSIEINITTNPDSYLIRIDQITNDIVKIDLYDLSGNLVDTIYKANTATNSIEYNTSQLSKGVYLLNIETDKESYTKKLIIE